MSDNKKVSIQAKRSRDEDLCVNKIVIELIIFKYIFIHILVRTWLSIESLYNLSCAGICRKSVRTQTYNTHPAIGAPHTFILHFKSNVL